MDGIVLINKEKGISSFGVVSKIRKIFNIKKVGHCGTLDPDATGVLPIMIGNATKISKYLVEHDKEYVAILKIGIRTDSADGEGNIIEEDKFQLKKESEKEYKALIENQTTFLNDHRQKLLNKVKVFRAQADKGFLPQRVQERCCNFKLLEEKCVEYTKKLGDK